jgi:hypothetical protein
MIFEKLLQIDYKIKKTKVLIHFNLVTLLLKLFKYLMKSELKVMMRFCVLLQN